MTPLHSTLKRALTIDGREYVLTLTQDALKLTLKGKRNGVELSWTQLVNGEAALAVALPASLGAFATTVKNAAPAPRTAPAPAPVPEPIRAAPPSAARVRSAKKAKRKNEARKK